MQMVMAELVGTMLLVLLGNGVVANVVLSRTKGQNGGWIAITVGWGVAVAMAVYAVGRISGAHINPAVTVGLAAVGSFPWTDVPGYVVAQMAGAFLGAVLVWAVYLPHWRATDDGSSSWRRSRRAPRSASRARTSLSEVIGTAVLLFGILAIAANAQTLSGPGDIDLSYVFSRGLQPLLVGILVLGIGLSLGGPTGYAINPARDLGPRLAHAVLPIPGKAPSDWQYAWIPVVGPILGGIGRRGALRAGGVLTMKGVNSQRPTPSSQGEPMARRVEKAATYHGGAAFAPRGRTALLGNWELGVGS
jgi:glycerol uptake facilitator protein